MDAFRFYLVPPVAAPRRSDAISSCSLELFTAVGHLRFAHVNLKLIESQTFFFFICSCQLGGQKGWQACLSIRGAVATPAATPVEADLPLALRQGRIDYIGDSRMQGLGIFSGILRLSITSHPKVQPIWLNAGFVGRWEHLRVAVIKKKKRERKRGTRRVRLDSFQLCV